MKSCALAKRVDESFVVRLPSIHFELLSSLISYATRLYASTTYAQSLPNRSISSPLDLSTFPPFLSLQLATNPQNRTMLLTVATEDGNTFNLDISGDMEIETLAALLEADVSEPLSSSLSLLVLS